MHSVANIDNTIVTVKLTKRLDLDYSNHYWVLTHKMWMHLSQKVRVMVAETT